MFSCQFAEVLVSSLDKKVNRVCFQFGQKKSSEFDSGCSGFVEEGVYFCHDTVGICWTTSKVWPRPNPISSPGANLYYLLSGPDHAITLIWDGYSLNWPRPNSLPFAKVNPCSNLVRCVVVMKNGQPATLYP